MTLPFQVLHFVAEALRKYPAPKKYTVPTRNGVPKPLSEVLRINGDSTLLEVRALLQSTSHHIIVA